ncbi:MAG: hypothetical protein ACYDBH_01040 [Acidobacteriaceae bacterium]
MDPIEKLWLQDRLNKVAIQRATDMIRQRGLALPCHVVAVAGSIVTVSFDVQGGGTIPNITIPKAESQYIRTPIQIGDKGVTIPADVILQTASGLGSTPADMTRSYGNLSTLMFVPLANKSFPVVNVNAVYVAGPDGVVIGMLDGSATITANASGISISVGSNTWTFTASGLTLSSGVVAETHEHLYTPGAGTPINTGEPVAP